MTGFLVEPAALDTFATVLGRGDRSLARVYMTSALTYVDNWVKLPEGQSGIAFSALSETTARVAERMRIDNAVIGARLTDSATNLAASAAVYRRTDHASASRLDQQYDPPGGMADGGNYAATAGSDPTVFLWIPTADNGVYDVVNGIMGQTSWFSLSGVVLNVLEWFGFDPMGALTRWLFGDAEAVSRVGNALARHASFDRECSGLLTAGRTTMQASWTGTAATAADSYFDDLADALLERSDILSRLSRQYVEFAITIDSLSSELSALIQAVIEPALQVAAALAAAGCLATIPPAAGVALIVGAWRTERLVKAIAKFAEAVDRIWTPAQGLLAIITTTDAVTKEYDASSRIPATAYSNGSQPG